jgi:hypothetical protein
LGTFPCCVTAKRRAFAFVVLMPLTLGAALVFALTTAAGSDPLGSNGELVFAPLTPKTAISPENEGAPLKVAVIVAADRELGARAHQISVSAKSDEPIG